MTALLLATACTGGWPGRETEVVIGAIGDPSNSPPVDSLGLQLAIDGLNDREKGRYRFRIAQGRDSSNLESIAGFRDDEQAIGIIGPSGSDQVLVAREVFADAAGQGKRALVSVSASALSPTLAGSSPWFFRLTPNGSDVSVVVSRFLGDSLRVRRAAVLYESDAFGRAWTKAFRTHFEASGGTVVMIQPYVDTIAEWPTYAAYARHVGAQVIVMPGTADAAIKLSAEIRAMGSNIPLVAIGAVDAIGQRGAEANGIHYTVRFDPDRVETAEGREFVTRFRERYKAEPNYFHANTHDAVMLFGAAVSAVGADRKKVRAYIESLGSARPALAGANGPIAYDSLHNTVGRTMQIRTLRFDSTAVRK